VPGYFWFLVPWASPARPRKICAGYGPGRAGPCLSDSVPGPCRAGPMARFARGWGRTGAAGSRGWEIFGVLETEIYGPAAHGHGPAELARVWGCGWAMGGASPILGSLSRSFQEALFVLGIFCVEMDRGGPRTQAS
jgi:hypothetical protein